MIDSVCVFPIFAGFSSRLLSVIEFVKKYEELYLEVFRKDPNKSHLKKNSAFGFVLDRIGFRILEAIKNIHILHRLEELKTEKESPEDHEIWRMD